MKGLFGRDVDQDDGLSGREQETSTCQFILLWHKKEGGQSTPKIISSEFRKALLIEHNK